MKSFHFLRSFRRFGAVPAALLLISPSLKAAARENAYDQLSATLLPIAQVFSPKGENKALRATLVLESMTGLPAERTGGALELAVQPPWRAKIDGSFGFRKATVVREGQTLRIAPPEVTALFTPEKPKKKRKKKQAEGLEPLVLPFPPEQLALLPILFTVKELAKDADGRRVLEVRLMPELARSLSQKHPEAQVEEWWGRLSLKDGTLARLELGRPGWSVAVRVERLEFARQLPPETWAAPENAATLEGTEARQWLNGLGRFLNGQADRLRK